MARSISWSASSSRIWSRAYGTPWRVAARTTRIVGSAEKTRGQTIQMPITKQSTVSRVQGSCKSVNLLSVCFTEQMANNNELFRFSRCVFGEYIHVRDGCLCSVVVLDNSHSDVHRVTLVMSRGFRVSWLAQNRPATFYKRLSEKLTFGKRSFMVLCLLGYIFCCHCICIFISVNLFKLYIA